VADQDSRQWMAGTCCGRQTGRDHKHHLGHAGSADPAQKHLWCGASQCVRRWSTCWERGGGGGCSRVRVSGVIGVCAPATSDNMQVCSFRVQPPTIQHNSEHNLDSSPSVIDATSQSYGASAINPTHVLDQVLVGERKWRFSHETEVRATPVPKPPTIQRSDQQQPVSKCHSLASRSAEAVLEHGSLSSTSSFAFLAARAPWCCVRGWQMWCFWTELTRSSGSGRGHGGR